MKSLITVLVVFFNSYSGLVCFQSTIGLYGNIVDLNAYGYSDSLQVRLVPDPYWIDEAELLIMMHRKDQAA